MPKYTKEELRGLIAETRAQLGDLLKAEAGKQVPVPDANGGQMKKEEESAGESHAPAEESSASSSESSGPPAPASDSASAGGPPAPDASASASAPADPAAGGSAGGAPVDLPSLVAAYSQLSPEELQMHVQALQQVMSAAQGAPPAGGAPVGAGGPPPGDPAMAGAPAGGPPPGGAPAPGPDAVAPMAAEGSKPVDPAMAMKSESNKDVLERLTKAEGNAKNLESTVEKLTKAMELMLTKPQRKAVTGKDLAKSAKEVEKVDVTKLTKAQLTAKLTEVARKPDLKKSERNLINSFYKNQVKVEALAPLFETKQ